jgi:hypothetical protein
MRSCSSYSPLAIVAVVLIGVLALAVLCPADVTASTVFEAAPFCRPGGSYGNSREDFILAFIPFKS